MKILALDIATRCGWALSPDVSGVWDLSIKRDESSGMRILRFRSKLSEIFRAEGLDLVVFESANIYGHKAGRMAGAMVQIKLQGECESFCTARNIEWTGYAPAQIKKHATGRGNAKKDEVLSAARERWGSMVIDDNHADAIWLWDLAHKDLQIPQGKGVTA